MSMSDDGSPVKPQSEVLYLLGGLNAKMDSVLLAQPAFDTRLRDAEDDIATLKAQQTPKTPWWQIASGFASIASLIGVVVTIYVVLHP